MKEHRESKKVLDELHISPKDTRQAKTFFDNVKSLGYDAKKAVEKLKEDGFLEDRIADKQADIHGYEEDIKKLKKEKKEVGTALETIRGNLQGIIGDVNAVSEARQLGIMPHLKRLTQKIRSVSQARNIPPENAMQVFFGHVHEGYDPFLGFKQSAEKSENAAKEAEQRFRSFNEPAQIVSGLLRKGLTPDQITRLLTSDTILDPKTYQDFCGHLQKFGSASNAVAEMEKRKKELEEKMPVLESKADSLKNEIKKLNEVNNTLTNDNQSLNAENLRLKVIWQSYQIPTGFYDFFRAMSGERPITEAGLVAEIKILRHMRQHGELDRFDSMMFDDLLAAFQVQLELMRRRKGTPL